MSTNGTNGNGNGNGNGANNKDVVYIDVDDEITGVIDKVRSSDHRIVALVLPKRAGVFQSIVNMKLLKRTSDHAKKHVVLITSDPSVLPLAGTIGIYAAKNLQSRPEIPPAPASPITDAPEEAVNVEDASSVISPSKLDRNKSIGELDQQAKAAGIPDDSIDLNDMPAPSAATGPVRGSGGKGKGKKGKKLKVPNFNKFRMLLMIGGGALLLLIILLYICLAVLPKAKITVKTDSVAIHSNVDLTLNPHADSADVDAGVVPSGAQQTQKTVSQQVDATGQRNDGTKASGSVTVTNCNDDSITIAAGTGFSAAGKTFVSAKTIEVPGSTFTSPSSGSKCRNDGAAGVDVVAQNPGAEYNIGAQSYSISGGPHSVSAQGGAMSGGTDKITKIVTQADINSAKQKISTQDSNVIKKQLQEDLQDKGYYPILATFGSGATDTSVSANPGDAADSVTVTQKLTYSMMGAKRADLEKLIANSVNKQIDPKKQKILDYGLAQATFHIQNQTSGGNTLLSMETESVAGSALDTEPLKKQVAGKKAGDAEQIIKANPSVTDVEVHYSPFWVSSIPKKTSKITIEIEKPQTTDNAKP